MRMADAPSHHAWLPDDKVGRPRRSHPQPGATKCTHVDPAVRSAPARPWPAGKAPPADPGRWGPQASESGGPTLRGRSFHGAGRERRSEASEPHRPPGPTRGQRSAARAQTGDKRQPPSQPPGHTEARTQEGPLHPVPCRSAPRELKPQERQTPSQKYS